MLLGRNENRSGVDQQLAYLDNSKWLFFNVRLTQRSPNHVCTLRMDGFDLESKTAHKDFLIFSSIDKRELQGIIATKVIDAYKNQIEKLNQLCLEGNENEDDY